MYIDKMIVCITMRYTYIRTSQTQKSKSKVMSADDSTLALAVIGEVTVKPCLGEKDLEKYLGPLSDGEEESQLSEIEQFEKFFLHLT